MDHNTIGACKAYYHDELLCGIVNSEFLKTLVLKDVAYNSGLTCRKFSQMAIAGKMCWRRLHHIRPHDVSIISKIRSEARLLCTQK
jgi:hypothetical protein